MDDKKEPAEEVETVSSIKDPSSFFSSMENRLGVGRLQHTPSMMEIPSSFIDDVFDEETYAEYDNKSNENGMDDDDDEDDADEYEYPSESKKEEQEDTNNEIDESVILQSPVPHSAENSISKDAPPPIPTSHSNSLLLDSDILTPTSPRRRSGCVSDKRIKRLHTVEEYQNDEDEESSDHDHELAHLFDDDHDQNGDDNKINDESSSHTMSLDVDLWNTELNTDNFKECNIRFEEDEFVDGKKLSASEFCSLRYFFQFIYDRFHSYSQFLLDTSLPPYSEWKKMRKVRIRNASLKTVDYALKECIKCVDSIKALVRNTIILCNDDKQPHKEYVYKECADPKILETTFNNGNYCIMAAWDLFDLGSTPSTNDWTAALNSEHGGAAQKLSSCLPDLSHLHENIEMKAMSLAFHNGKAYKYQILSEFVNENGDYVKFGAGPIEWKLIKQKFLVKHGIKYRNQILKAFDTLAYYINPPLRKLNDLMSDKSDQYVSRRRIIAEPIMWLFYMVSLLIERQEKLQQLYITAMSFKGDNNNKGQKLNGLITNLAKQAKDESERLRAITAKLPQSSDLKQTLIDLVKRRDPENKCEYTQSLSYYQF